MEFEPTNERPLRAYFIPTDECPRPQLAQKISYILISDNMLSRPIVLYTGAENCEEDDSYRRHEEIIEDAKNYFEDEGRYKTLKYIERAWENHNKDPHTEEVNIVGGGVVSLKKANGKVYLDYEGCSRSFGSKYPCLENEAIDYIEQKLN